jgi:AcrR family transcriptional regulator
MADRSSRPFELPASGSSAERLLDKTIAHLVSVGDPRESLRSIAEAIGTSHRMLQYHFGSKERLLGSAFVKLTQNYVESVDGGLPVPTSRAEYVREAWKVYRQPENFVMLELLLAVTNPAAGAVNDESLMVVMSSGWSEELVRLGIEEGLTPERAENEARLIRNAWRGLHEDLYGTNQGAAVDAAVEVLIEWIQPPR